MLPLTVVIPTYRRPEHLRKVLQSLVSQDLDKEKFEIRVVANTEEPFLEKITANYAKEYGNVFYHCVGKVGVNRARNLGVSESLGEIILFLDDDCVAHDKAYLRQIIKLHQRFSFVEGIGGHYKLKPGANLVETAYHLKADQWLRDSRKKGFESLQLIGGNQSFKRDIFTNRYKFNENICFGGAEADLNLRLVQGGKRLYLLDGIEVEHRLNLGWVGYARKAFYQGMGARTGELLGGPSRDSDLK